MKAKRDIFIVSILLMAASAATAATNDLNAALQRGLFEEEANHNLDAAIQAYQSVINQYDKDRRLAATAIFRLGESYRKQGKTNEAILQYERVLREFADQGELVAAARSLLPAASREQQREGTKASPADSTTAEEVNRIQALIKESPDLINSSGQGGETLLQKAAAKGESAVVKLLLDSGAAVDGPKQPGLTALHYAAGNGHKAVVDLLLSRGAKADARAESGVTPLHLAALNGYELVAKTLLQAGAPVNARTDKDVNWGADGLTLLRYSLRAGKTPLHAATEAGYSAEVELLLSKGADVNIQDGKGRTPLSYAVERRDAGMATTLLAAHADPNAGRLNLPLEVAAWNGDTALLELLLTNGANPNTYSVESVGPVPFTGPSPEVTSPLFLAVAQKYPEAVKLLIRYKADPNAPATPGGNLLLFSGLSDLDVLRALLEGGASANTRDSSGVSALQREVEAGNQDGVQLLLAHKADVNATDQIGRTPLSLAAVLGAKEITELLLKNGADPNARMPDGTTPLHAAVRNNRQEIVELLLVNKADPNARDNSGTTPLDLATSSARPPGAPRPGSAIPGRLAAPPPSGVRPPTVPATTPTLASPAAIADLLRQHGALEDLPRLDCIRIRRPGSDYSATIFSRGTNDWNRFTLLELLGVQLGLLGNLPNGVQRSRDSIDLLILNGIFGPGHALQNPDFAHVHIRRASADGKTWRDLAVDLSAVLGSGDCTKDVPLEWGDVVEVLAEDRPRNDEWRGFSGVELVTLTKCLQREVEIVVKGKATKVALALERDGGEIVSRAPRWLKPVLRSSKLLLPSSDLSHVKITRRDPASGQMREWVLDCSDSQPAPDFWLRDGDVIEVPDKS